LVGRGRDELALDCNGRFSLAVFRLVFPRAGFCGATRMKCRVEFSGKTSAVIRRMFFVHHATAHLEH
jgi:hypothetical protein